MNKIKMPLILLGVLLVVGIALGVSIMHFGRMTGKTYKYSEGSTTVLNPYIGYAPSSDSVSLCEKASLVYFEILWSELEPEEGQFNWDNIEYNHYIDRWRTKGKKLVIRFVCDKPGKTEHMDIPQWLYDKTGDGVAYDMEYGRGYCPDYNNEIFISAHEKAIKEIADHFRGEDYLAYVELGSLGHWGEWHTYYMAGLPRMPETIVRARYVQHYVSSFDYCKLLMRRPFAELPEGAGVFNDMTGIANDTNMWLSWINEGGDYNETGEKGALKAVPGIWEYAPVGGEFASSVPISVMLGKDYDKTAELLKASHMSFIGPMVPYLKRENLEFYESSDKLLKYVGYRYRISTLSIKRPFGGKSYECGLKLINDGVAPIYFDFTPCIYVEVPGDPENMRRYELDVDLKTLCQDQEKEVVLNLPKELLDVEGAKIYAGIENDRTGQVEAMFDMETERKGKLSLLWENK
ncbi:DUF4832 domain-containing protein [Butyrivibrio sp. AE2032]|uniref:DUF4832 domain-containing protein n=1 Tax=Butyrivibrio sp. AE2032 TaxID=1458463 RepID=UPI0009DF4A9D|nr:DUF4832 domain-containing protein [Butyrivibrio sp. AE2032]